MIPVVARDRAAFGLARKGLGSPVVLVPTMGALHTGHRGLLRRARELAGADGAVVVSVFVNPLQFGPSDDLERYPRTLDEDSKVCRDEGVAVLFAPGTTDMYADRPMVTVDPGPVGDRLEGAFRPGFFRGVLTIVIKLFGVTRPDIAVFGEKDAQQLALVRRMVTDFDLSVQIAAVPTVRDPDGVAISSRNTYLSPAGRSTARFLNRALLAARDEVAHGPGEAVAAAQRVLAVASAADPPLEVDYLSLAEPGIFTPVGENHVGPAVLAVAARVGGTRLIDNSTLEFSPRGPA